MAPERVVLPARWPLVGRERTLHDLAAALRRGRRGAVLVGPAGVGKSRLIAEAAATVEAAGHRCLRAVTSPGASAIPLGAFAALLPELPPVDRGPAGLVRAAVDALAGSDDDRPPVLLVDDVALLDDISAAAIHQAVASGDVRLLATVRPEDATVPNVVALWKDERVARIDVEPLTPDATGELLSSVLGGEVDRASRQRIWAITEGNPLYVQELILSALHAGALVEEGERWHLRGAAVVSGRLRELLVSRLTDTDEAERGVLELLAIGAPLGLAALVGLVPAEAVEHLERRGLVSVGSDDRRRPVTLAHPLHGELLRSELPTTTRIRLLQELADAVEACGARRRDDIVRVATWRVEGGGTTRPDLVAAAARLAFAGRDVALAERLARAAVEGGADDDSRVLHSMLLAELGRHRDSDAVLAALEASAGSDADHALAALRRSVHLLWSLGDEAAGHAVLDRAEGLVVDPAWRDELRAQRANLLALAGRPGEALDVGAGLLDSSEPRVVVRASSGAAIAATLAGRFEEAVTVAASAWRRQRALADQRGFGSAGFHVVTRSLALVAAGRLSEARPIVDRAYELSIEAGDLVGQGWLALARARLDDAAGSPATAERWAGESAAAFAEANQSTLRRGALGAVAVAAAQRGDRVTATRVVRELDDGVAPPMAFLEPDVDRARAWSLAASGDLASARSAAARAAAGWSARGAVAVAVALAGDLVRFGAPDEARLVLADLVWPDPWTTGDAIRAWSQAGSTSELEAVARRFDGLGMRLLAAEAAAQGAAQARAAGSARTGQRLASWSAELAEGSGAATPALSLGGEAGRLTAREDEIARLAAVGATNRAIAERLAISERTVENHLQRAYVKLGISRREELASALGPST